MLREREGGSVRVGRGGRLIMTIYTCNVLFTLATLSVVGGRGQIHFNILLIGGTLVHIIKPHR